mmetsp:Transcript_28995/g.32212  ORF Transcript_28995/g.32212 Transcript_28995/m.32212 type:complete len:158 (-) Transcript_28995:139-612(-)
MMLDFFGMRLVDFATGEVGRKEGWEYRYINMQERRHNNLRISRMLKSLGHLGFTRYKQPFIDHLTQEVEEGRLRCRSSLTRYWRPTLDLDTKRYKVDTLEDAEDREDSIFLQHVDNDTPKFYNFVASYGRLQSMLEERRRISKENDLKMLQRYKPKY